VRALSKSEEACSRLSQESSHGSSNALWEIWKINHTTLECRVGTNKCTWCDRLKHLITTYPQRLKVVDKGTVKPLPSLCQGPHLQGLQL